jgi:alpha-tubulin suppressor-like RCC1 family protein
MQVGSATNWSAVSSGQWHACALTTGGAVFCWGDNTSGQTGAAVSSYVAAPAQVGSSAAWTQLASGASHVCARQSDQSVWCWGLNTSGQLGLGNTTSPVTAPTRISSFTSQLMGGGPNSNTTLSVS